MLVKLRRLGGVAGLVMLVALFSAPVGMVQAVLVWQSETVDEAGDVGLRTSLALDSQNQPHISYKDFSSQNLKYATYDGVEWQIETVDATGGVGLDTSLALDANGQPHISYVHHTNGSLNYATYNGTAWQINTVDESRDVGPYSSLALDADDQPHIGYFDINNDDLKYATFDGTAWQIEIVDEGGFVGWSPSLALDSNGQPRISYLDASNDLLKYAVYDGSDWQIETVDDSGDVGPYTSLALDASGQPHISYFDASNFDLKYAVYDSSDWQIETVDDAGDVGRFTSLALDANGQPHISYFDDTNDDLKYATFDGSAWQIETVDEGGDVGGHTSLALDANGQPHISYNDASNFDLKYAQATLNHPPTSDANGPYTGEEGSPINIEGAVSDPESDELTTTWSYMVNGADDEAACEFGDTSQIDTTFTCDDDGSFTINLTVDDGLNPPVSGIATVTLSNAAPIADATATITRAGATITVVASDPGDNDPLTYRFDCDADGSYEFDTGITSSVACPFNQQHEGAFTFGVQVSDDDGGVTTDAVTVTIATELCTSNHTGVLRYSESCRDYEMAVVIPSEESVTVCASTHNGLLRQPLTDACADHEISYLLPEAGPLSVCVSNYTQTMRVADDIVQCTRHEFGRVIAATEVGDLPPPRSR